MQAYAAFEGGGARGYAHVGALQASEERGISFEGVAGTSIGAVVAALVAAGYTSSELFRLDGDAPAGVLTFDPIQKLNSADWSAFQRLSNSYFGRRVKPNAPNGWFIEALDVVGAAQFGRVFSMFCLWALLPILALKHRRVTGNLMQNLGITSAAGLAD